MIRRKWLAWTAVLAFLTWAGISWCAPPESSDQRPLDRQLLNELNARPGDDIDRELFGPGEKSGPAAPPSKPEPPPPKPAGGPAQPARDLSRVSDAENPLVDIARQMREAERLIAQAESGEKTQGLQEQIVKQLEELLKKLCKKCGGGQCTPSECKQCVAPRQTQTQPKTKPSQSSQYKRPKERSEKKLNPVAKAFERPTFGRNTKVSADQRKSEIQGVWGLLPEREREQMMRLLPPEQFLPKYEPMIEEYYRRLGEETGGPR